MTVHPSTTIRRYYIGLLFLCLGPTGACVEEESVSMAEFGIDSGQCTVTQGCPTNAHIGNDHVGSLHLGGLRNDRGFALEVGASVFDLVGGELLRDGSPIAISDVFQVSYLDDGGRLTYYNIHVLDKGRRMSYTHPEALLWWYRFGFQELGIRRDPIDVCEALDGDTANHAAYLLRGETYSENEVLIDTTGAAAVDHFQIACELGGLAKMLRFKQDPSELDPMWLSTPAQRQSTLFMIIAGFCGDAVSFTHLGTPIGAIKRDETVSFLPVGVEIEALWTTGVSRALCLQTPRRLEATTDPKDILDDVYSQCGPIPTCDDAYPGIDYMDPTTWPPEIEWASFSVPPGP